MDETLIDTIIDIILPPSNLSPKPEMLSMREKRAPANAVDTLSDLIIDTFFPDEGDSGKYFVNRWKRSISSSNENKIDKSAAAAAAGSDANLDDESADIVEIKDHQARFNVWTPNSMPPVFAMKRPYSKKKLGNEYRDTVFMLYSAQIPGNGDSKKLAIP